MIFDPPPAGYRVFERRVPLGAGDRRWQNAVWQTMHWGIKLRSGFRLARGEGRPSRSSFSAAAGTPVVLGDRMWLQLRLGPVRVNEPVQVSLVIDEAHRQGFAYATRPGHQLEGEELFLIERDDEGHVWLMVRTMSRPARGWGWATPLLRLGQQVVRRRYLRALIESPDRVGGE